MSTNENNYQEADGIKQPKKDKSVKHLQSTIATKIGVVTIQKILFGKGDQFSGLDEFGSLQGTRGRKGPASTAKALIFHVGNTAQTDPVDTIRGNIRFHRITTDDLMKAFKAFRFGRDAGRSLTVFSQFEMTLKFVLRHVRIGVVAQGEFRSRLLLIVLFNAFYIKKKQIQM